MHLRRLVAEQVRQLRLSRRMSQQELAALSGLSQRYISCIETCKENATLDSLEKLASALSVSIQILFTDPTISH